VGSKTTNSFCGIADFFAKKRNWIQHSREGKMEDNRKSSFLIWNKKKYLNLPETMAAFF
jgi:hypothetical protein